MLFLSDEIASQTLGGAFFVLINAESWMWYHYILWVVAIVALFELFASLINLVAGSFRWNLLIARGKPLDVLTPKDIGFIYFNRVATSLFTYHLLRFSWLYGGVEWNPANVTLMNTLVSIPVMFVVYDFFYTGFHRFLHLRSIYGWIHKHHHRQTAPSRGNMDAVNVHPFEFLCGEYNHLLAIFLTSILLDKVHFLAICFFIVVGGVLASLNHTRYDIRLGNIFQVRFHDLHHWVFIKKIFFFF
jgi:sterol desaturase/sphingolipid hydroxylase (fatty acid hydroxylase superfamily)